MTISERLDALRMQMRSHKIDYYIIFSQDAHQSEYVSEYWRSRAYFSGFTGSAGTLAVTLDSAFLWVDGRYHIQAEKQLEATSIKLFKMGLPDVPGLEEWLQENVKPGQKIACDGRTISMEMGENWRRKFSQAQLEFEWDLAGEVWRERPLLPDQPVFELGLNYAGESRQDKICRVRKFMTEKDAGYLLLSSLDDIAWLTNLRGRDIDHTPVFYAYMLVGLQRVWLFAQPDKFSDEIRRLLSTDGVDLLPYDGLPEILSNLEGGSILLNPARINMKLGAGLPDGWKILREADITTAYKACKNAVERDNIRQAHIKDGVAMVRFLKWIQEAVQDMEHPIDECDAADYLDRQRLSQPGCFDLSFGTIAGYNANGASAHYSAKRGQCAVLRPEGMIVVDSGGQYWEGTTDITRTIVLGPVTEKMKKAYTLVLKGHLALGRARFLTKTPGYYLDILARGPLWQEGMDFRHGTGHGVGYVLSVHEGPQNIGRGNIPVDLQPGMLISNEPGYYAENEFGVRIENLLMVRESIKTEDGQFLEFETMTLCPYDWQAIDESLLNEQEKQWIDQYHKRVYETLSPYLTAEERDWLAKTAKLEK